MAKPTRSAAQLKQMLIQRIEALPGTRGRQTDVHRGGVIGMPPEEDGPNWTVRVVTDRGTHRSDIAQIIRTLQMQFDSRTDRAAASSRATMRAKRGEPICLRPSIAFCGSTGGRYA